MARVRDHMLTTTDNPFDPFDNYAAWFNFDAMAGYHTPSYLARICRSSDDLSEADQARAEEEAMDEIVKMNINGMYRKVSRELA